MYIVQKVHLSYQYLRDVKCARAGDLNETTTAIKTTAVAAAMTGFSVAKQIDTNRYGSTLSALFMIASP